MKTVKSHNLSHNLPVLHSFNTQLHYSYTLTLLHTSNLTLFQSYTLSILDPSNPTLFQSYTLPILHSSNPALFRSYTLPSVRVRPSVCPCVPPSLRPCVPPSYCVAWRNDTVLFFFCFVIDKLNLNSGDVYLNTWFSRSQAGKKPVKTKQMIFVQFSFYLHIKISI